MLIQLKLLNTQGMCLDKMEKQVWITILIGILIFFLIGVIGDLCLDKLDVENVYIQCCGGQVCSDTYYTSEDNLCHLVLCENNLFSNKEDCVYEGANISLISHNLNEELQ